MKSIGWKMTRRFGQNALTFASKCLDVFLKRLDKIKIRLHEFLKEQVVFGESSIMMMRCLLA